MSFKCQAASPSCTMALQNMFPYCELPAKNYILHHMEMLFSIVQFTQADLKVGTH